MSALQTNDKGNTEKLVQYIGECRYMGIEVLPPDVNASQIDFAVEEDKIRFGLSAIKNAGEGAIRSMLANRSEEGKFTSLFELGSRLDTRQVNKRALEALVQAGAMDSLGGKRSALSAAIDSAMELGQKARADRDAGQTSLFGGEEHKTEEPPLPDLPEWDEATRLSHEKTSLGFYVSGHPLYSYEDILQCFKTQTIAESRALHSGTQIAIAGMPHNLRRRKSKSGDWWASMQLEDLENRIEVLVFPKSYATAEHQLAEDRPILVSGRLDIEEERVRLIADEVCLLDELLERRADAVEVRVDRETLDRDDLLPGLRDAFTAHRGDAPIYFEVEKDGDYTLTMKIGSAFRVTPSRGLTVAVESLVGKSRVRYRERARQPPKPRRYVRT